MIMGRLWISICKRLFYGKEEHKKCMGEGNREPGTSRRYASDKPRECSYCYFWDRRRKRCGQKECWYLLTPDQTETGKGRGYHGSHDTEKENCRGCPYGRHFPCIGYCMKSLMEGMRLKKQESFRKGDGRDAG